MKPGVYMYFNGDLFLIDEHDVWAGVYLIEFLVSGAVDLEDIIFVSEYLGEL